MRQFRELNSKSSTEELTMLTHRVTEGNLSALRFDFRTLKESLVK